MAIPIRASGGKAGRAVSKAGNSADGLASRINFVKPPGAGQVAVQVSVAKLEASLAADAGFHVGPGGTGAAIAGRYPQAQRFLADAANSGIPVHMTRIYVDRGGQASISDGRHRFAVLRDSGATTVPVSVPRSNAARVRRLFGAS